MHTQIAGAGCTTLGCALQSGALPVLVFLSLYGTPASAAAKATVRRPGLKVLYSLLVPQT